MSSDCPAYLQRGDELAAKYKGSFYKAKIIEVDRRVECKVYIKTEDKYKHVDLDKLVVTVAEVGKKAHYQPVPDGPFTKCLIQAVKDKSSYIVEFEDGIQAKVNRKQLSKVQKNIELPEKKLFPVSYVDPWFSSDDENGVEDEEEGEEDD